MNDLEITRLCAEAMGRIETSHHDVRTPAPTPPAILIRDGQPPANHYDIFNPLYNDEQAMALVKRLCLELWRDDDDYIIECFGGRKAARNKNLNRAICECVAKMQAVKG